MRLVATIPDEALAKALADYLLTRDIATKMIPGPQGVAVWVHREEKVPEAQAETSAFLADPDDPRYQGAARTAEALRKEAAKREREHRRKTINLSGRLNVPSAVRCPVTYGLIFVSIAAAVLTGFGSDDRACRPFLFADYHLELAEGPTVPVEIDGAVVERVVPRPVWTSSGLDAIRRGQLWRLVSPIFLHFGIPHLVFNMIMLYRLGSLIELRKGRWAMLAIVLISAVASNFGEFLWETRGRDEWRIVAFGGMSGVVYALFGYVWMKSDYDPEADMKLPSNTILYMVAWLFFCMTGAIGPIANAAHVVGLGSGIVLGLIPHLWAELRGSGR